MADEESGKARAPWSPTPGTDGSVYHAPSKRPWKVPAAAMPRARVRMGGGVLGSVSLHALILFGLIWGGTKLSEMVGTGPGDGPAGGGGGGGTRVSYIELPPFPSAATARARPKPKPEEESAVVPVPVTTQTAPEEDAEEPTFTPIRFVAAGEGPGTGGGPGTGPGSGGGIGSGIGTGIGSDVGPGTGGGQAYAAEPRAITYPVDDPPASIRGREFFLHFWVDARGRVTRVEIEPPIADVAYRKKLLEHVSQWIFYPARTQTGRQIEGELRVPYRP